MSILGLATGVFNILQMIYRHSDTLIQLITYFSWLNVRKRIDPTKALRKEELLKSFLLCWLLHESCALSCSSEVMKHHHSTLSEDIFPWALTVFFKFRIRGVRRLEGGEMTPVSALNLSLDASDMWFTVVQLVSTLFRECKGICQAFKDDTGLVQSTCCLNGLL